MANLRTTTTRHDAAKHRRSQSEQRYELLVKTVPHGIQECDTDGVITFSNPALWKLLGYEEGELLGKRIWDFTENRAEQEKLRAHLAHLVSEQPPPTPYSTRNRTKDGRSIEIQVDWAYRLDEKETVIGFVSAITDVTERTRAEQKSRAARLMFQALAETVPAAIAVYQEATHQYMNRFGELQTGYCLEELRKMDSLELVHPDDREMVINRSLARERGEDVPGRYEFKFVTKAGQQRWVDFSGTQIEHEGEPAVLGVTIDITERKRAEEALRESERRFRTIFEQAAVGVAVVDSTTGEFLQINRCYCEMVGYRLDEMIGNTFQNITHSDDLQTGLDNMASLRAGETREFSFEKRYLRKDGSIVWVNLTASRMWQSGDEPTTHIAIAEDITARKKSEQALKRAHDELEQRVEERTAELAAINRRLTEEIEVRKRTEQELNLASEIMENMAEGVVLVRVSDTTIVFSNPRFDEMFGYDPGELTGQYVSKLNAPSGQAPKGTADRIIQNFKETGIWSGEVHSIRKDETPFWTHAAVSTFEHLHHGTVRVAVVEDITVGKQAESALRANEKRLRDILDGLFGFVGLYTTDGVLIDANRAPLEAAGLKKEDVISQLFWDTYWWSYSPEVQAQLKDALRRTAQGEVVRYDVPVRVADDRFIEIDVIFSPLYDSEGNVSQLLGFAVDITERKLAEQASQAKQAQLDDLLSNVGAIVMEGNGTDFYYVGGQVEKILGYPKKMWFEHPDGPIGFWTSLLHPDDSHALEYCQQAVERGEDHTFEYRLIAKNGKLVWFFDSVTVEERDGKPAKTRSVMIDVTEIKRAEAALSQFKEMLDQTLDSVFMFEPETLRFVYVNRGAMGQVGYSQDELLRMTPLDIKPEIGATVFRSMLQPLADRSLEVLRFETVHRHKDGHDVPVEVALQYVSPSGGPFRFLAVVRDITDRKQLEEEVREHQERLAHVTRLSTMGEMATGLAHEINQPLAAISSYCYIGEQALESEKLADPKLLRELFRKSTEQTLRAGEIIRRLRALVVKRTGACSQVDIIEPIEEVLNVLTSDLRHNDISVELRPDHSKRVVNIDEIQIQQVLVNLFRNAIDAMSDTVRQDRTLLVTTSVAADERVEVAIRDTGKGILAEEKQQVFDAFFSTKSEGMGMGLAISRTIIESHGGQLWVTSNSERGATFHFTLPLP